jgi:Flp pilus assembly protein TadD
MLAGRNDPCPCGSGRKYKKCCQTTQMPAERGLNIEALVAEARQDLLQRRFERAEQLCAQVLDAAPGHAEALHLMGLVSGQTGRYERAVKLIREALRFKPDDPVVQTNLAVALHALGRNTEALEHTEVAIALEPQSLHVVMNRAIVLLDLHRWAEAAPCCELWARLDPNNAEAHRGLGDCYARQGLRRQAVGPYAKSLSLEPDAVEVANNLGACLAEQGQRTEALAVLCHVVERHPDNAAAWANLGVAAKNLGDLNTALRSFDRALMLEPAHVNARWNRSLCLLGKGRLAEGWVDYEGRWKASEHCQERPFPQPRWDGSNPAGKTILVWLEQGLGDRILFASMLPDLARAGAHSILECDLRLVKLFARSFPDAEVVPDTEPPHPRTGQPDIDFQIPAGSLARWFRPNLDSFPKRSGYLVPDAVEVTRWRKRLAALGEGLKVGICWRSGQSRAMRSAFYSQLNQWGPILTIPGIHCVNLQYDDCREELREAERLFGSRVHAWNDMDLKNDQDGLAALMTALDLVISAGTAVDALAGAVGVPAWVLTRGIGDWWGLGTNHCPWNLSIRPFSCGAAEPWEPMIARMAGELGRLAEDRNDRDGTRVPSVPGKPGSSVLTL